MSAPLLSEPRQSLRVWIAVIASALLHVAAIALAEMKREPLVADLGGPFIDIPIDGELPREPDGPPPDTVIETATPVAPRDESFPEDIAKPPAPKDRPRQPFAPIPRPQSLRLPGQTKGGSAKQLALLAPRPEYPYEARRAKVTGQGIAVMTVDPRSGLVTAVSMGQSTGSAVLDQATLAALRRWRFRPGTATTITCPVTYTLTGASL